MGELTGLRRSLYAVLALLVSLVLWSLVTEVTFMRGARSSFRSLIRAAAGADDSTDGLEYYPDEVFETDWSTQLPTDELLHVSVLHRACVTHKNSVIPWDFGLEGRNESVLVNASDPQLLEKLRQCPDVDIFLPDHIRSFGYCEDAVAYTKFLQARMIPLWVAQVEFFDAQNGRNVTYYDLCPHTPMLFFNHFWEGLPTAPNWPATKPLYLMPNIEMYELNSEHYWMADVVLCKTAICARYLKKWYRQEGNPKGTKVLYTRHTSSDVALAVRTLLAGGGDDKQTPPASAMPRVHPKNFSQVEFLHTPGTSIQKGTSWIFDCWLSRPDFPPVHVVVAEELYKSYFEPRYGRYLEQSRNIRVTVGKLDSLQFGQMIAEAAFFLCPSVQEGYGHYINQARASGGVIITTDVAPMNELITPDSGVLIRSNTRGQREQFLGGNSPMEHALRHVDGFVAMSNGKEVCKSVEHVLTGMSVADREAHAAKAHQQYLFDTIFFAQKMQDLRAFARGNRSPHRLRKEKDEEEDSKNGLTTPTKAE